MLKKGKIVCEKSTVQEKKEKKMVIKEKFISCHKITLGLSSVEISLEFKNIQTMAFCGVRNHIQNSKKQLLNII